MVRIILTATTSMEGLEERCLGNKNKTMFSIFNWMVGLWVFAYITKYGINIVYVYLIKIKKGKRGRKKDKGER